MTDAAILLAGAIAWVAFMTVMFVVASKVP